MDVGLVGGGMKVNTSQFLLVNISPDDYFGCVVWTSSTHGSGNMKPFHHHERQATCCVTSTLTMNAKSLCTPENEFAFSSIWQSSITETKQAAAADGYRYLNWETSSPGCVIGAVTAIISNEWQMYTLFALLHKSFTILTKTSPAVFNYTAL